MKSTKCFSPLLTAEVNEPLIDMSIYHLIDLYREVESLS